MIKPAAIIDKVLLVLSKLPPEAYGLFNSLLNSVLSSRNPMRALERAAKAAAAKTALDEGLKATLGRAKM